MEQWGKNCPPFILGARKIMLWVKGIEKAFHDLMDKLPAAALEKLIQVWWDKQNVPLGNEQSTWQNRKIELWLYG